jgi:hypothetical protein
LKLQKRISSKSIQEETLVDISSEYITLKGSYYGKVTLSIDFILFDCDLDDVRPENEKFLFGSQAESLKQTEKRKKIAVDQIIEA